MRSLLLVLMLAACTRPAPQTPAEGIRLAKAKAAKQKLAFEAVVSDIEQYDLGKDRWGLRKSELVRFTAQRK